MDTNHTLTAYFKWVQRLIVNINDKQIGSGTIHTFDSLHHMVPNY
jgi:hypothetical protein